jgi:hypothetical protein
LKPLPPPHVPGKTEFERFDNPMRKVLTVSKQELVRREEAERHDRDSNKKKEPKKS